MKKIILLLSLGIICFQQVNAQYKKLLDLTAGFEYNMVISKDTMYLSPAFGGTNNWGFLFAMNTDGSGYRMLHDFIGDGSNGLYPKSGLTLSGNTLYGVTESGGKNGRGILFSIKTDGHSFKNLYDFTDSVGSHPGGTLILSGNVLFGMTGGGGKNNKGVLFSINTDGSNYKVLLDFDGLNGADNLYDLTLSANTLYGTSAMGGINNDGVIFSIQTDGTGYHKLLDFNGANGKTPRGGLIVSGGNLYGATMNGGKYSFGCIFSIHTDGTSYQKLYDFTNINLGIHPEGNMALLGKSLYGVAEGGANAGGMLFSISIDSTKYKDLFDFPVNSLPSGVVISKEILYGTTDAGGPNNKGGVFSYNLPSAVTNISKLSNAVSLFPNPTYGLLNLYLPENTKGIINICNSLGQSVLKVPVNSSQMKINLQDLLPTLYFVNLDNDGNTVVLGKVVKTP